MINQILLALVLTSATVLIHAIGIVYIVLPLAGFWSRKAEVRIIVAPVTSLVRLVSALLLLHIVEMCIWAAAFLLLGVLPDFETSLYFSLQSYVTVGYGDVLPESSWRLLGPIEAAVGILMLGLSTGFIVAAVQRIYNRRNEPTTDE